MGQVTIRAGDGRLTGSRGLTEQQRLILEEFSIDGTLAGTAEKTGIDYKVVSATLRLAHVQAALLGECRNVMARAAPEIIKILTGIARNPENPIRVRLDAGKTVLDRVGLSPVRAGELGQGDKRDLSDLSPSELSTFIQQGQTALAQAEAVTVDCAPATDLDTS